MKMKPLQLTEKEIRQLSDVIAYTIFTHYIDAEYREIIKYEEAKQLSDDDLKHLLSKLNYI